jgi:hypothetical protein
MSQKSVVAQAVAEHCGNDIVAAVTAQNSADGKWERAARSLFKQGARVEMLKRKPRGPEFDESLETVVEAFIVQAMTASTKPFKFSAGRSPSRKSWILIGTNCANLMTKLSAQLRSTVSER